MSHGLARKRHRNDRSGSDREQYNTQQRITELKLLFQGWNVAGPDAESEPVSEEHRVGRAPSCANGRREEFGSGDGMSHSQVHLVLFVNPYAQKIARVKEVRSSGVQEFRRSASVGGGVRDRLEAYGTLGVSDVRLGRQQSNIGVPPVVSGLPPRPTEQKATKRFEQKVAKVTKGLGSTFFFNVSNCCR